MGAWHLRFGEEEAEFGEVGAGSYPGVWVVEHDEDDEDVGGPGGAHGAGHPLLALQEETAPVRHDDQQLGRLWRRRGQRSRGVKV